MRGAASWDRLALFLKIVEVGSVTAAADQIGLSKSAVSTRMAEFEASVGVRLLTRSKKGVIPTQAGERMRAHGQRLMAEADAALDDVRRDESSPSGQVRISVPAGIADDLLFPVLSEFLRLHPRVRLDVSPPTAWWICAKRASTSRCALAGSPMAISSRAS